MGGDWQTRRGSRIPGKAARQYYKPADDGSSQFRSFSQISFFFSLPLFFQQFHLLPFSATHLLFGPRFVLPSNWRIAESQSDSRRVGTRISNSSCCKMSFQSRIGSFAAITEISKRFRLASISNPGEYSTLWYVRMNAELRSLALRNDCLWQYLRILFSRRFILCSLPSCLLRLLQ